VPVVTGWLGVAGLAMVGSLLAQRRAEVALDAVPEGERIGERIARPSWAALAVIALALVLFVALGRGPQALAVAVTLLVGNAWALAGARWWAARGVEGAGPWRAWSVAQAVAATGMFLAAAAHLRGW
jgi:hypothetical protein